MADPAPRRRFLCDIAVSIAVPAVASAQDPAPPPADRTAQVDALTALARARFGRFLNEAGLREVRQEIELTLRRAERLQRLTLGPTDEPATIFVPGEPE